VRLLALVAVAACSKAAPSGPLEIASEPVTFAVGSNQVPGTLVHPARAGRYRGIVLMAGSGPTDRDWNSPLVASRNGSGKLLAEALAKQGAVVLRFDKAGIAENKTPHAQVTLDTYRDEGRAALALLRARTDVDPKRLFVAGHSEGGVHALRVALAERDQIAGLVLLSSPGRRMADVLYGQIGRQLPDDAARAKLRTELDDFLAGQPPSQTLVAIGITPGAAALGRDLFAADPAALIAQLTVPVFIYNGLHDVQVDPELDAKALAAAHPGATLFLAPEADHVLKHETKTLAELHDNALLTEARYNAPDRDLDPATVRELYDWLAAR
jgi:pimeloyl-ACP methyl ester carboxylesterase